MGTQGIGGSPEVQIRPEQITFLFPFVWSQWYCWNVVAKQEEAVDMPITTRVGRAGKGKSEPEGPDNTESISNDSITTRAFQVWQSCLEKVSWAPWVVALEQLSGTL